MATMTPSMKRARSGFRTIMYAIIVLSTWLLAHNVALLMLPTLRYFYCCLSVAVIL